MGATRLRSSGMLTGSIKNSNWPEQGPVKINFKSHQDL